MAIRAFDGKSPLLGPGAWVDPTAVVIGDVRLGADASVWPMCVLRGDIQRITIGARTNIQDGCVLHVTHDSEFSPGGFALNVGEDVTVGHKVILHGCTVGNECLIGMGAIVMDGAVIGPRTVLSAGCLVPGGKTLEGGYLYLGSPAKQVRALTAHELGYFLYASRHYVNNKNRHAASQ
jgi:carbonic anhydrase/acetyltransferase-like protein (isoleucine patch superfamily)